ncbi:YegP family protein [Chitinophaga sp. GCM10012297]|uniref:YegP family protein n=1 Tax=Chitinophaga chungangae TaxID=2821488 RepID=A0ABS3YIE6_9BACT|nr:YegP family protein [Chitinophaga chungangae]MBO9154432.1 YegP family protein [Chitinophaga chungangae]
MGKFVITSSRNGEYRFKLIASNGEIILVSEGYSSKAGVLNGINAVKLNATIANRFEKVISSNGKLYFNLKSSNGMVIGTSEMYESVVGRDRGIDAVVAHAPDATIEDSSTS